MIDHKHERLLDDIAIRIEELVRSTDVKTADLWACECAERALLRERAEAREPYMDLWNALVVTRKFAGEGLSGSKRLRAAARAWNAAHRTTGGLGCPARSVAWSAASAIQGHMFDAAEEAARGKDGEDLEERQWQLERLEEMIKGNVASKQLKGNEDGK